MNIRTSLHRTIQCARMGILWPGTSRFITPTAFRWKGQKFNLRTPDEKSLSWIFRDVVLDDEYGLRNINPAPQTILDIGANVGIFSLWAGIVFPNSTIHSYEPNTSLLGYLEENLKQVGASIFPEGVSQNDGFGTMTQEGDSMLGVCAAFEGGSTPLVSLRTAIKRIGGAVDLLKLDCEGAEWSILEDETAFEGVSTIRIEYHLIDPAVTVDHLIQKFHKMGFDCLHLNPNSGFGQAWFQR